MNTELVLNPCEIANGEMNKSQLKDVLVEKAQVNNLLPLDELRFMRILSKASDNAASRKVGVDAEGKPVMLTDLAVEQAIQLPQLIDALAEDKKEFIYNGCRYQFREEVSADLSTRSGEEAETWKENKKKAEDLESQIADLRTKLSDAKGAMAGAEERYIAKHPTCKKTVKRSIVVL